MIGTFISGTTQADGSAANADRPQTNTAAPAADIAVRPRIDTAPTTGITGRIPIDAISDHPRIDTAVRPEIDTAVPAADIAVRPRTDTSSIADIDARAREGDFSGYVDLMRDLSNNKRLRDLQKVYEEEWKQFQESRETHPERISEDAFAKQGNDDIISYFQIGKSLGASAKNYPVRLPNSRNHAKLAEGQEIIGKVFAGAGTEKEIRDQVYLETNYKIPASKWQKVSGKGYVIVNGKKRFAELHWYEADGERVDMKVKRWLHEG